ALSPDRDQSLTNQAIQEFEKVGTTYPTSPYVEQARKKIVECHDRLAEHERLVARFYQRRKKYNAAIDRYRAILDQYPLYNRTGQVLLDIGTCLLAGGNRPEAEELFRTLYQDQPDGKPEAKANARPRVLQHEYVYSARQKNWAIPQAKHEWILLVDSDERVTPGLREEILALLASGPRDDGYWILRANHFLGRRIKRCGWGTDKVIRLFRRDLARYQDREVHAEIDLPGPLPVLAHPLEHHSFRSFAQYWRKIQIYSEWGA